MVDEGKWSSRKKPHCLTVLAGIFFALSKITNDA